MLSRLSVALVYGFFAVQSYQASAVDDEKLWLPGRFAHLFSDLKDAAEIAEKFDGCKTVLRGTLDFDQSKPDYPMYRILCRQPDGISNNFMVDGVKMEVLTEDFEGNKSLHWELCNELLLKKVKLMAEVEVITKDMPEPDLFTEERTNFTLDFNGKNPFGVELKYTAKCSIIVDGEQSIKISPRR